MAIAVVITIGENFGVLDQIVLLLLLFGHFSLESELMDLQTNSQSIVQRTRNKAQQPTMRPHAFFGISYHRDARDEMRGGNLSTAIVTIGGRYARELF